MKKLKITFQAMLLVSVILSSCGDDSTNISNDSITEINAQVKIQDSIKVADFVKTFYSSLELSPELNQKQYVEGGVQFNLNKFKACVDNKSVFSQLRISNLTGDYHALYNIELLGIDSITEDGNNKVAYTTVEYEIYELGTFQNFEKLIINPNQNRLLLNKWEDIKIKKMSVAEYEGLDNFNEKDFYRTIGSINK